MAMGSACSLLLPGSSSQISSFSSTLLLNHMGILEDKQLITRGRKGNIQRVAVPGQGAVGIRVWVWGMVWCGTSSELVGCGLENWVWVTGGVGQVFTVPLWPNKQSYYIKI